MGGAHNDIANLQRRIDHITRAATRIRAQLEDLHTIAYEATTATTDPGDRVNGGTRDHSPRSGHPVARHLWQRADKELARCEDTIVGLERAITGWFMVSASVAATRGSLIRAEEHDALLARQRRRAKAGEYTPARLVDQPNHPGRKR